MGWGGLGSCTLLTNRRSGRAEGDRDDLVPAQGVQSRAVPRVGGGGSVRLNIGEKNGMGDWGT